MRNPIIAGNWKMHKDIVESAKLINALKEQVSNLKPNVTVVVCPPYTSLAVVGNMIRDSVFKLGAQNMSERDEGAFTGEIAWTMLKSVGCEYVILGHSERRQYFGETNELINMKARKALSAGFRPIICVGEKLEERELGITDQILTTQIKGVLSGIAPSEMDRVVVAYEPVWAIGTGKTATPLQAQEAHAHIRKLIAQIHSWAVAEKVIIQYGGSVKPDNAADLLAQSDIDGALVGGACLEASSFGAILNSARA